MKDLQELINTEVDVTELLCQAIQNKQMDRIEFLVSNGADINKRITHINAAPDEYPSLGNWVEENKWAPIHFAIHYFPSAIPYLAQHGADVELGDENEESPLFLAYKRNFDAIEPLLQAGANPNSGVDDFFYNVRHDGGDLASLVFKYWGDINQPVNPESGKTLLHDAAEGYPQLIEPLLAAGANPNVQDTEGNTPLHFVYSLNRNSAELLFRYGANIHILNDEGVSPLRMALDYNPEYFDLFEADSQYIDMFGVRSHNMTDDEVQAVPNGVTPLHIAVSERETEIVSTLLADGANPNIGTITGRLPIHTAFIFPWEEVEEIINLLVAAGANIHAATKIGETALHYASAVSLGSVNFLLDAGLDPNSTTSEGITPLHLAIVHSQLITERLLKAGANSKAQSSNGQSFLHVLSVLPSYRPSTIELLIEYGADINAKNCIGETPLQALLRSDLAENQKRDRLKHLFKLGADSNIKV